MIKFKTLNIVAKSVLFNQGQIWTKTKNNSNENPPHDITIS